MGLIGGLIQKRPNVPEFKPVDAQAEQIKAISGNQAALAKASELASGVNSANQDALLESLKKAIPGYEKISANASKLVEDYTAPGIPKDIQDLIRRKSTARALEGGFGGSQAATNLELRNLGLTGLELAGKKLGAAESWLGFARQNIMAPQFDVSSMFLSPQQQISLAVGERDKRIAESRLLDSGLAYTILQPTQYFQVSTRDWKGIVASGEFATPFGADQKLSLVKIGRAHV